jgi:hypothetical protein
MAEVDTIMSEACSTGIGKETDQVKLLQIIAQTSADFAAAEVPGLSIEVSDILERACTSGIAKETDPTKLLQIIAQLLNDVQ